MDTRLDSPYLALRYGIGLMATLAGLDKFFNLLTDWGMYLSPTAAAMLPVSPSAAMAVVGVVEVCVGLAILTAWTRYGALVASVWLLAVAGNLVLAGFLDSRCATWCCRLPPSRWRGLPSSMRSSSTARTPSSPEPAALLTVSPA